MSIQCAQNESNFTPPAASELNKRKCKLCQKSVLLKYMRIHVAQHILKNMNNSNTSVCGFCGKSTCTIDLVNTSKKQGDKKYKCKSNCDYASNFNLKSAETSTKGMPCCNRPIHCPLDQCNRVIWFYNLENHYNIDHKKKMPDSHQITDLEKTVVLKFKC